MHPTALIPRRTPLVPLVLALCALGAAAVPAPAQEPETPRISPSAKLTQQVALSEMSIEYSRPAVRGRQIWGGLVPYGEVWRTGANEATRITFGEDVVIAGTRLPAGSYSLATIPSPEEWTVILNKETDLWGAFAYDQEKDALRIQVEPEAGPHEEWLTFSFTEVRPDEAEITLAWEKVRVPFTVELAEDILTQLDAAVAASEGWQVPLRAANYLDFLEIHPEKAMEYADASLEREETYANLALKAELQASAGETTAAVATAERALAAAAKMERKPDTAELESKLAGWRQGSEGG